jgi:predicted metal-binding protein
MCSLITNVCPDSNLPCLGKCAGYGTSSTCPPLIVLAVLATAPVCCEARACR